MRKLLYAISLAASLAAAAAAQTGAADAPRPQGAAKAEDCGCEGAPLPEVLAVVVGGRIARQDISASTRNRIEDLRRQVTDARKRELGHGNAVPPGRIKCGGAGTVAARPRPVRL